MVQQFFESPLSMIALITGFITLFIGMWGMLTRKNLIHMVISFSLMDTGINLVMVTIGYIKGRTAPIMDADVDLAEVTQRVIDPIPSALVLTAIVIGLGVTALMLSYVIQIYKHTHSLSIDDCSELKW